MTPSKFIDSIHVKIDAFNRAARTFFAGLVGAVVVAIVPAALILAGQIKFTREWWTVALASLGTIALNAISSYIARYVKPPKSDKLV